MLRFLPVRWCSILVLGPVLGLASATHAAAPAAPSGSTSCAEKTFAPFDLTYLPALGPQGLLGIRPAALAQELPANRMAPQILALLKLWLTQFFDGDLTAAEPPPLQDIEECVLGVSFQATLPTKGRQGTLMAGAGSPCLLRTTRPFDWKGMVKKWFPQARTESRAGREYLCMPCKPFPSDKFQIALFVPDDRTLVCGCESQVQDLLDRLRDGQPGPTPPPGWTEYEREPLALALDSRTIPWVKGEWPAPVREEEKHVHTLLERVGVLAAGVRFTDQTEVRLTALAQDPEAAREAVKVTQQLLDLARRQLDTDVPAEVSPAALKLVKEALAKITVGAEGPQVRLRVEMGCNLLAVFGAAWQKENWPETPGQTTDSFEAADCCPTRVGSKWVYQQGQQEFSQVILAAEKKDDGTLVHLGYQGEDTQGQLLDMSRLLVTKERLSCLAEGDQKYDPPRCVLQLPLKSGQGWETDTVAAYLPTKEKCTVYGAEEVEVPAGKFKALRVVVIASTGGQLVMSETWYASGVGVVKKVVGEQVWVLKSFTPGKE